ncbi:MAG TPA: ROK family transcriptional regulator, partial [Trueperaceae bacterium]|nr:ROK family transcriptional regulator [Trueperaceae bacterium]
AVNDVPATSNGTVLQAVYRNGPLSRAQLAEVTGLSKASISNLTRGLLTESLLTEASAPRSGRGQGRPHVLLDVNPNHGWFAGVRIDEDSMRLALTDLKGAGERSLVVPIQHEPQELAELIGQQLGALASREKIPRARLLGLGIAVSGIVDHRTGICHHSANLGWRDVPIGELVRRATGLPTRVENDTNAVAIAQQMFGRARDVTDFMVVTLGRGIGAAEFLDGRLYRGPDGGAGELGHCTVEPDGETCRCGKRGCLDTVAAEWAILDAARRAGLAVATLPELERLAATGSVPAMTILKRAGGALGLAISHLINIQSPQLVLVSGIDAELGAIMLSATRQAVENSILPRRLASTIIEYHNFDENLWARGAASIAAHHFLVNYGADD